MNDMKSLHMSAASMKEQSERLMRAIDGKLNHAGVHLQNMQQSSSALGTAVMVFAGLAGIAMIGFVWAAFIRTHGESSKKFV